MAAAAAGSASGAELGATAAVPGRRVNLEFPPPPPYPPPQNGTLHHHHTPDAQRHVYQHRALVHHTPRSLHDYAYAYYDAGPSRGHSPIGSCSVAAAANTTLVRITPEDFHQQDYHLIQQAPPLQQQQQQQSPVHQQHQPRSPQHHFLAAYNNGGLQDYELHEYRTNPHKRHTYVTRYGTEENIYEEISEIK